MNKKAYNLTAPQKSILYTEEFYKGSPINNICGTTTIYDKLDFNILEKAVNLLVKYNDSFRLRLTLNNNEIKQYLEEFKPFNIKIISVSSLDDVKAIEEDMVSHVFDIYSSPLFEFRFFRYKDNTGGIIFNIHHLFADSWTLSITVKEILRIYSCLLNNKPIENNDELSYINYIYSEEEYINSNKFQKDKEYWNNIFSTIPEACSIPSINPTADTFSCTANRVIYNISEAKMEKINEFCKSLKVSAFNFFMAIYSIYIGRVSKLDDFVVGTPILNRTNFKEKNTTGMFINIAPLRINIPNNISFKSFVYIIAKDSLALLRHQKYSYQYIIEDLRKVNPSLPTLYNIVLSYQVTNTIEENGISYKTNWSFNGNSGDDLDIHLFDINNTGSIDVAYDYRIDKYSEDEIDDLHKRIIYMIDQVIAAADISVDDIEIVTKEEKSEILNNFNNTSLKYDENIPFISYFEKQVELYPDNIALTFHGEDMSYYCLNERANSLACLLRNNGVTNNSIVGIMVERSFEMIISILAVLKSGGAYIPIDPDYPDDRINYMVEDSKMTFLLTKVSSSKKINCANIIYTDLNQDFYLENKANLDSISNASDLSYLIYTSGSTGLPKGVMLTQKSLCNFYHATKEKFYYLSDNKTHSVISITTVSFDIFAFETLISLANGLHLFMTDNFEQKSTLELEKLIRDNKIEIIQSTPSVMRFHLDNLEDNNNFSSLKCVILAGEQLPLDLVTRIKNISNDCTVYNGYGPSETTIFSSVQDVTNLDKINIGKPIANTQFYILDKKHHLLPKHHIGEIYIAGDGLGNGYLGKPDLTNKGFLPNPFIPDTLFYKTGDLGLWLDDGCIECKGRIDHQIKLRGLRIELEEIEHKINTFKTGIKSAVVVRNENQTDYLYAFIEVKNNVDISVLKSYLISCLPNYMIPSYFIILDKLPQTPNGKIDRKLLKAMNITHTFSTENYIAPRNEVEKILVNSIMNKLNIPKFGIDNNIFDYGADSLSIINILTDLFQYELNLKVNDFYMYPTVRQLADYILLHTNSKQKETENFIKLDGMVKNFNKSTNSTVMNEHPNILLTGPTGFLGIHILSELLDNFSNGTIYCLVRSKNNVSSETRLKNKLNFYFGNKYDSFINSKIKIIDFDIANNFTSILSVLPNDIDLVIHCAANVKHYGIYSEFEKANISGTQNIIDLCKNLGCNLHYISTMTVSGNYLLEQDTDCIFDENSFYKNQEFDNNVYAKSKLIAESLIIDNISNGLNATIYRVGDLTGRFKDGLFQENISENAIYLRLKSILEIGYIPDSILDNPLEFTPVDCAANSICKIIYSNNNINRIFHIYNPNMISTKTLIDFMDKLNYPVSVLSKKDFIALVKSLSSNIDTQAKIAGIINDFTKDDDLIYNYTIKTNNDITCNYLSNLSFKWPNLDYEYFYKLLNYMKSVNFII